MRLLEALRRFLSRIWIRLLAFNVLLLFLPVSGLLYLDTYEEQLLVEQENAMAQQGRLLAAALAADGGPLGREKAERILEQLNRQHAARLRVIDRNGELLADSARLGPRREPAATDAETEQEAPETRESWVYRLGAWLYNAFNQLLRRPGPPADADGEDVGPADFLDRPEVAAGLAGSYGAASRPTPNQRSLTLSSVLPVRGTGEEGEPEVVGVVLVSRSTWRILQSLYLMRLKVFKIFLASVVVAVVLSLLVATTIARPVRRLQREAHALLDRRGRLLGRFRGVRKRDEIGDLTRALEELRRRLVERISLMESFATDVAHEFKNPLASIRAAAEMAGEVEEPEQRRRFAEMIQRQVARMEHLLTSARELTHIDAQVQQEERRRVDLPDLLGELVEGYRIRGEGGVDFALDLAGEAVAVEASAERLAQALEKLLDNAVSFSPPGGRVEVRCAAEEGRAVVEVADEGPGIPEEHLEAVFGRFFTYRPDPGTGGTAGGDHSGLGLSVARAIVEGYGGSLLAGSAREGGALLRLELPLQSSARAAPRGPGRTANRAPTPNEGG